MAFVWGLLVGWATSLLAAVVVGWVVLRRVVALERRARQAERLAELGTLTGGLAHEIKNPLSTVQLNLQLLQEDLSPTNPAYPRIVNRLNTVINETTRLREILDDFLRYAGRIELDRQPVELNEMLEELVDFFAPQAQAQRVRLRLRKSAEPIVARIDAKLVKQAILNLMINGLQAMQGHSGDGGGELILSLSTRGDDAVIDVIDTGPGIAPEHIDKIFQAYYSTKRGGTGLGLPMARRIAEEHGGSLNVRSEPGKGSDFELRLPLKA
ncbi:sensor histidine kinase [Fontivita pretiosa]|uniref:sensor histidine kinase n=1 Tax=Fontivita pretiosa TaxID=2989684 RepID=UPI003D16E560